MKEICVLLSSYNGEKYIKDQVESIINQKYVLTNIIIRDDGSIDNTLNILKDLKVKYPNRITIIEGKNIGYRKSFMYLLQNVDEKYEFVALSDQDDYWESEKIFTAIKCIDNNEIFGIYSSSLKIVNEKLENLYIKDYNNIRLSLGAFFIRTRLAGCTMVIKREVIQLVKIVKNFHNFDSDALPDHDAFLCMVCMSIGKKIYVDNNAFILHRRISTSQTGGGKGILDRIFVEYRRIFKRKNCYNIAAKLLLDNLKSYINLENIEFLECIINYKKSFMSKIRLIFNDELTSNKLILDMPMYLKILLNKF